MRRRVMRRPPPELVEAVLDLRQSLVGEEPLPVDDGRRRVVELRAAHAALAAAPPARHRPGARRRRARATAPRRAARRPDRRSRTTAVRIAAAQNAVRRGPSRLARPVRQERRRLGLQRRVAGQLEAGTPAEPAGVHRPRSGAWPRRPDPPGCRARPPAPRRAARAGGATRSARPISGDGAVGIVERHEQLDAAACARVRGGSRPQRGAASARSTAPPARAAPHGG